VNSVLNLWVPWKAGKLSSGLTTGGLLSGARLHSIVSGSEKRISMYCCRFYNCMA
jgi:hypothetical protein